MAGRLSSWVLGTVLAAFLLSGCSGVLWESKQEDGRIERVKIEGGESWSTYDDKPRYPQSKTSQDDMSIILKKETTF